MKNLISLALLLAVAISCNGQAPPRPLPPRPVSPGNPAPSNPNSPPSRPAPPPRQQQPGPAVPGRPAPAPAPQVPGRPAPAPQVPGRPAPAPQTPVRPPGSLQNPQQGPQRTDPPVATTTRVGLPGQTTRSPNVVNPLPTSLPDRPDVDSFPTAPNIAPIPPVHFPPNDMPNMPPVNGPQLSQQLPQTLPTNPGRRDPRCPQFSDPHNPVHLPHESNCGMFYKCDHGMAFEYRCPTGQHWNANRNYCDFPSNAGCQTGGVMPRPQPLPQQPFPPTNNNWNQPPTNNNWNQNQPPTNNNWNQNQPRNNNNQRPSYEHPIVIPMAPRT